MRRAMGYAAAGLVVLVISGCTAVSSERPQPVAPESTAQTLQMGVPDPAIASAVVTDECHPWEFTPQNDPEQVTGWKQQVAVDSGPRAHATGTVTLGADGTPVAYVVAVDDLSEEISERFCMNEAYLNTLNSVRRDGVLNAWLYAGDTLNLDAHTILTVGDQNGHVMGNTPPSPIPPQR